MNGQIAKELRTKNAVIFLIILILTISISVYTFSYSAQEDNTHTEQKSSTGYTISSSQTTTLNSNGLSIHVSGNELVNAMGQTVRLIGINIIAGACVPGQHSSNLSILYDGGLSNAIVAKEISQWDVNVVRITPNEDCWLGINGVNSTYSGQNYRDSIENFVNLLNSYGIYAIIDLHASAPGGYLAIGEQAMADQDHSISYWQSVAMAFKNNSAVLFEPYNEPHITRENAKTTNPWDCWLNGCNITVVQGYGSNVIDNDTSWQAAGMQELVNTIRSSGATNPILLDGLNWSQNLTGFLGYLPNDSDHQLAASYHNYDGPLNNMNYWNTVIESVTLRMPVVTTEMGENDCSASFVSQYMTWADSHGVSYVPWVWTNWQCSAYGLLANWNGSANSYGQVFLTHFDSVKP